MRTLPSLLDGMFRTGLALAAGIACVTGSVLTAVGDDAKVQQGRQAKEMAAEQGWIEGICTVELIRPDEAAYRMGNGNGTMCGWGACQGANHGDLLLRAFVLTKNQKYLDAACLNADWHLGANPLSKTLITNMGYRPPRRPEISWFLYEEPERDMSGNTVKGISIYGIGPPLRSYAGHPGDEAKGIPKTGWPLWRSWRDVWNNFAEIYSEFTVPQTCGPATILYSTLYAMEKEAGLIPTDSKPDPLAR